MIIHRVLSFETFDNRVYDLMEFEFVPDVTVVTNQAPRSPIVIEHSDEAAVQVIPADNKHISI